MSNDLAERELHLDAPGALELDPEWMPGGPWHAAAAPGGTATGTFTVTLDGVPVTGTVTLVSTPPPPPPPPGPTLVGLTGPQTVVAGATFTLTVTLSGPAPVGGVVVPVYQQATLATSVIVLAGFTSGSAMVGLPLSAAAGSVWTYTALLAGVSRPWTLTVVAPIPPPPTDLLVTNFGAKGDGVTDNLAAFNAAVAAATLGQTIRVPAGNYYLSAPLIIRRGVRLLGDGNKLSTLFSLGPIVKLGDSQAAAPVTSMTLEALHFYGRPGLYQADGYVWAAVQNWSGQGAVITNCDFTGTGYLAQCIGTSYGTRITNCRMKGWGEVAIFCNGGEVVSGCLISQDDPSLTGNRSSHGLYIHSGAKDVLIQDTVVENARKFGAQIYGQEVGTTTERITFRRVTFKACRSGLTIQQGEVAAARAKQIVVDACQFTNTYEGCALGLKQGDGISVSGCTFDGGYTGMEIGVWAPYSVNFSLTETRVWGNIFRNCQQYGIWAAATYGGRFVNVTVGPNTFSGCRQEIERSNAPGITWL